MKKICVFLIALCMMALSFLAYASESIEKITVAIGSDPANLSPFTSMNLGRIAILKTMYEYLVEADSMGTQAVPVLAKSVEQTGEKTYVVTIFENIADSAGNHITAADVVWSFTQGIAGGNLRALGSIESVNATGDYTVEFVFKRVLGVGDLDKALTECPVVSQKAYESSPDKFASKPIATGPYVLKEYVPGSSLTFEKRADYWQTDSSKVALFSRSNVQQIVFQIITEPAQHAIALQTNNVDISASVSVNDLPQFQSGGQYADKFSVFEFTDNLTWVLAFNGSQTTFQDKNLRQAIAYAIDTAAICQAVHCVPAHTMGNSNFGGYQAKWDNEPYYNFDLDKAKELFAASGHKSGDLAVKLLIQNDPNSGLVAQIIQAQLAELGITVNIDTEEASVYNTAMYDPKGFDIVLMAFAGGDYIISPWLLAYDQGRNKGTTGQFFKDDQLQSLLMTASSVEGFIPENIDAFHQYHKEQVYDYGLYSLINSVVAVKNVSKIVRDTRGQIIPGACEYTK